MSTILPARHVPANHLLRAIDHVVDLSGIRAHLRPFYSDANRIQLRVGGATVAYDTNPKFEELMRELPTENTGATSFFDTEVMLADCRRSSAGFLVRR